MSLFSEQNEHLKRNSKSNRKSIYIEGPQALRSAEGIWPEVDSRAFCFSGNSHCNRQPLHFPAVFFCPAHHFDTYISVILLRLRDLSTHGNKDLSYFRVIYGRSPSAKATTARTKLGERFRSSGKFQLVDCSKITTRIEETRFFYDRLEERIGNLSYTAFSYFYLSSLELVAIIASFNLRYSK